MEDNKDLVKVENTEEAPGQAPLTFNFSQNKPKSLKSRISSLFLGDFDISKSVPSANESYLVTKYGHAYSFEERVDSFLKDVCNAITNKNNPSQTSKCDYACVTRIPIDLIAYKDSIINVFKEKGYIAVDLKDTIEGITKDYLFVCWDKFDSSKSE